MEATIHKLRYWQPVSGGLQHVWVRRPSSVHYDGDLTEQVGGDRVWGSSYTWKPQSMNFSMGWPGYTLPSDALPSSGPTGTPTSGYFQLNLQTCRGTTSDPCPLGVRHTARVNGTIFEVRPVVLRTMDLIPGSSTNVITPAMTRVPFVIFGSAGFLPEIEIERSTMTVSGATIASCEVPVDINGDGYADLKCHFDRILMRPRPGDPVVRLVARTRDGNYIRAVDTFTLR